MLRIALEGHLPRRREPLFSRLPSPGSLGAARPGRVIVRLIAALRCATEGFGKPASWVQICVSS